MVFFGIGSTLIDAHTLSGQTEGLRVGGGMGASIYIACLRQVVAFAPKVIKCAAYGDAIMNGRRNG